MNRHGPRCHPGGQDYPRPLWTGLSLDLRWVKYCVLCGFPEMEGGAQGSLELGGLSSRPP